MRQEFEYKRSDGTKHLIKIEFILSRDEPYYRISVYVCLPKKRTFKQIDVTDDYVYRGLPFGGHEREEYVMAQYLKHVTAEEILECKLKVWESLKPF